MFGNNTLAKFMQEEGLNSTDVAKDIGLHRSVIYKVSRGIINMSPEFAVKLSKAYGGDAWSWWEATAKSIIKEAESKGE